MVQTANVKTLAIIGATISKSMHITQGRVFTPATIRAEKSSTYLTAQRVTGNATYSTADIAGVTQHDQTHAGNMKSANTGRLTTIGAGGE